MFHAPGSNACWVPSTGHGYRARVNPAAEGTTYPDMPFVVDAGAGRGVPRACSANAQGVPPTFLTAAEFTVMPTIVADPRLDARLHAGGARVAGVRLRPGAAGGRALTVKARLESVQVRAGTGFLTIAIDLVDEAGEPRRHVPVDHGRTGRRLMRAFDDVSVGDELPSSTGW